MTARPQNEYMKPGTIYQDSIVKEIPFLLSWLDREPLSLTYGCADRNFWGWKFVDFPGARFQESIYSLAHLYTNSFNGNSLAGDPRILKWIVAGMRYWGKIQYGDGSFDEAYPFERSLAATAFTGFYVGEAFLLIQDRMTEKDRSDVLGTLNRAGVWLSRNDEGHGILSNHLAVAAAALDVIGRACGVSTFQEESRRYLRRIYDHQSDEGWYEEYGGCDPGYQTHATFYLARLWQQTRDPELLESLRRSIAFLKYFIHPNATLGGEYGSRNTEIYFPAGFEILAPEIEDAALIAGFMRSSFGERSGTDLQKMDAYNFLPLLNSYLFAEKHALVLSPGKESLPFQKEVEAYFDDAGILVKSTSTQYYIFGLSKGGVIKAYDKETEKLVLSDCGYWGRLAGDRTISSQSLCRPGMWEKKNNAITVETDFVHVNQRFLSTRIFIGFRLFILTLGRLPVISIWLKNLLVFLLVRRRKKAPLQLQRSIRIETEGVKVVDRIKKTGGVKVASLKAGSKFSSIHMGSSRYFHRQELDPPMDSSQDWSEELEDNSTIVIKRMLSLGGNNDH